MAHQHDSDEDDIDVSRGAGAAAASRIMSNGRQPRPSELKRDHERVLEFQKKFLRFGGARRHSPCSGHSIKRNTITPNAVITTLINLDITVWISMILAVVATWLCLEYKIYWNTQVALLASPIVFPLAFSINESYRRREKVSMATYMLGAFFCNCTQFAFFW